MYVCMNGWLAGRMDAYTRAWMYRIIGGYEDQPAIIWMDSRMVDGQKKGCVAYV
jgi:hypothetical protein